MKWLYELKRNYISSRYLTSVSRRLSSSSLNSSNNGETTAPELLSVKNDHNQECNWIKSKNLENYLFESTSANKNNHIIIKESLQEFLISSGNVTFLLLPEAQRVISGLLTYPLTLSFGVNNIFPFLLQNISISVIGARAEHSLPRIWWQEMLRTCSKVQHIELQMVGPGTRVNKNVKATKVIKWRHKSNTDIEHNNGEIINNELIEKSIQICTDGDQQLHEMTDLKLNKILLETDLFVLFNPGLNSPYLQSNWKPTLQLLFDTKKPVLVTAFSETDMQRDVNYLNELAAELDDQDLGSPLEFLIQPALNPFRSLRRTIDDSETEVKAKIISTNQYVYAFQSK